MKKRILSAFLAICMMLALAPAVFAEGTNEAKIGNTEYSTLQEAISAATEGQTATLLKDVALTQRLTVGNIYSGDTVAETTAANIILDLDGHTLTGPEDSRVIHVNDSTFTVQNGTVKAKRMSCYDDYGLTGDYYANAIGVNSGELHLKNLTVTTDAEDLLYFEAVSAWDDRNTYTLTVDDCDLCPEKATVYLSEEREGNTATISSGKIDSSSVRSFTMANGSVYDPNTQTVYNAAELAGMPKVAEANGIQYPSFAAAAFIGGEVKLLSDVDLEGHGSGRLVVKRDMTLDLNGHTLRATSKNDGANGAGEVGSYGNAVTFTLTDSSAEKSGVLELNLQTSNYQSLFKVMYGSTFKLDGAAIKVTGTASHLGISNIPVISALKDATVILNGTVTSEAIAASGTPQLHLLRRGTGSDAPHSVSVTGGTYFNNEVTTAGSDSQTIDAFIPTTETPVKVNEDGSFSIMVVQVVDGEAYASLQEAVGACPEGSTIKLLADGLSATVSRSVTFTIDPNGHTYTLYAGSGYEMRQTGDTYTFTQKQNGGNLPSVVRPPFISPVIPTMPGLPFTDVADNAWYYDAVEYVYNEGLMNGVGGNKFNPTGDVTRGMVVTILYRMEGEPRVASDGTKWWSDACVWAMEAGVSDGTNMDGKITREQLAAMLYRYAKRIGADVSARGNLNRFSDAANVSGWAETAMQWAVGEGVIGGSNGRLNPKGLATRAEVATMFMRFDKTFG